MRFDYKLYKPRRRIGDTAIRLNKYFRSPDIQLSPLSKIGDLTGKADKPASSDADQPRFIFGRDFDRTRLAFAPSKGWQRIQKTADKIAKKAPRNRIGYAKVGIAVALIFTISCAKIIQHTRADYLANS